MAYDVMQNLAGRLAANDVRTFLEIAHAYDQCDDAVKAAVDDMKSVYCDDDATAEEKQRAVDVIVEALFPSLAAEAAAAFAAARRSPAAVARDREMDEEEARFASAVLRLMKVRGLTQEQLGERVGVGQAAVSNILSRRCRPQQKTVAKFAAALGVPPADLWPARRG